MQARRGGSDSAAHRCDAEQECEDDSGVSESELDDSGDSADDGDSEDERDAGDTSAVEAAYAA